MQLRRCSCPLQRLSSLTLLLAFLVLRPTALRAEAPPAPDVLGAVEGIPITQEQFDRLAKPYFEEVRAKANRDLSPEEKTLLRKNVLEEMIRERLWISA